MILYNYTIDRGVRRAASPVNPLFLGRQRVGLRVIGGPGPAFAQMKVRKDSWASAVFALQLDQTVLTAVQSWAICHYLRGSYS